MKLQFTLDELSSLRTRLLVSTTKIITYSMYIYAKLCTRVYFEYSLRANQHTKLDRTMLFTRQIFASECDMLPLRGTVYVTDF